MPSTPPKAATGAKKSRSSKKKKSPSKAARPVAKKAKGAKEEGAGRVAKPRKAAPPATKARGAGAPLPSAMEVVKYVVSKSGKGLTDAKKRVSRAAGDLRKFMKKSD